MVVRIMSITGGPIDTSDEPLSVIFKFCLATCGGGIHFMLPLITALTKPSISCHTIVRNSFVKDYHGLLKISAICFALYPFCEIIRLCHMRKSEFTDKYVQEKKDELGIVTILAGLANLATIPFIRWGLSGSPVKATFMQDYGPAIKIAAFFFFRFLRF